MSLFLSRDGRQIGKIGKASIIDSGEGAVVRKGSSVTACVIILTSNTMEQDDDSMNMSGGEEHHPGSEIEIEIAVEGTRTPEVR